MIKESKNYSLLIDTEPLIKLFSKEKGWEAVQKILQQIESGSIEAAISVITLTEINNKYLHEKREDLAKIRIEALMYATYLKKIGVDEKIAVKAGAFKGKYSIPITNSLISASAFFINAIIISNDADFKKITEIQVIDEADFFDELGD